MRTLRLRNILQASLGVLILLLPSACSVLTLPAPERTGAKEPPTPAAASPASAAADATAPTPPADWAVADSQEGASAAGDANGAGQGGLDATPAWSATGDRAGVILGWSVSAAGDVNGDGYDDVIVGVPRYDDGQPEEGVVFLYASGPDGPATSPAWTANGGQAYAWFGIAVATAGDVNGDGYGDVIVGAYQHREVPHVTPYREGVIFVYHGGPAGLTTGAADWTAAGGQREAKFGLTVATAGDVSADGYADVAVGAPNYEDGQPQEGAAFVYHGGPGGLDPSPARSVQGNQEGAGYGFTVATAGDVNGDSISDLIVDAPTYNSSEIDAGGVFVYLGSGGASE